MAGNPAPPQTPGDQQLVTADLLGDERIEIISRGSVRQVITLDQLAAFIGGGPVTVTTVPNGGTGLDSLTLNGILYGNNTNPVGVTAAAAEGNVLVAGSGGIPQWTAGPGTAGFVLTSNGSSAIPSFQAAAGGSYPPSPTPDFQTFLQNAFNAGTGGTGTGAVNWIWGDVALEAPVVVNFTGNINGFVINLNGATISPASGYTVNTAVDMVTLTCPNSAPSNTNIVGLRVINGVFLGLNPSAVSVCRNVLQIGCQLNQSGIYNGGQLFCEFIGATRSGCQLYGSVFEWDVISCGAYGNTFAGFELRNPNVSGHGIISSVNFIGGDFRSNGSGGGGNGYGLASTAETAFQEATGFHVYMTNFIVNASAGIFANSGVQDVRGCHFENNDNNNASETTGAIWVPAGFAELYTCDAAFNFGNQINLLDITSAGSNCFIERSYSLNESSDTLSPVVNLAGNGTLYMTAEQTVAAVTGGSGWTIKIDSTTEVDLGATTGTNTMTTTPAPAPVQGVLYTCTVTNGQTSTTPTLNTVTIVKRAATALASGDMPAGSTALLRFNGSVFQLLNPVVP